MAKRTLAFLAFSAAMFAFWVWMGRTNDLVIRGVLTSPHFWLKTIGMTLIIWLFAFLMPRAAQKDAAR